MTEPEKDYRLYLLCRNDLPSLNPGKMAAQAAHSANQFVFELYERIAELKAGSGDTKKECAMRYIEDGYLVWRNSTKQGFGTTITLSLNYHDMVQAVNAAKSLHFPAGITHDPEYPFMVDSEVAALLAANGLTIIPRGNQFIALRPEDTGGYIFGDAEELRPLLGRFPLFP